jgi:hypothetical protein
MSVCFPFRSSFSAASYSTYFWWCPFSLTRRFFYSLEPSREKEAAAPAAGDTKVVEQMLVVPTHG